MRKVEGYVCTVEISDPIKQTILFGEVKDKTIPHGYHEPFSTNGLTPYETFENAVLGYDELCERKDIDFGARGIGKVQLEVADTQEDLDLISQGTDFVVLVFYPKPVESVDLLGESTEGSKGIGYIPGSLLYTNGFTPFSTYERALYSAQEVRRQAQCQSTIARFKFARLGEMVQLRLL